MIYILVGVERFELPTSWSQTRRATRLRYTPRVSHSTLEGATEQCYLRLLLSNAIISGLVHVWSKLHSSRECIVMDAPPRTFPNKKGATGALFILLRCANALSGLRLLLRSVLVLDRLHRQAYAALFISLQHLDLDRLAFLEVIGNAGDALMADLGDVQQAVLAG